MDLAARLEDKFTVGDGCWEWTSTATKGYGKIRVGSRGSSPKSAHRVVYEWLVGPIPDGLQIDHLCRNTLCVRPDHLEPVTGRENIRRYADLTTHCPRNHPYDEKNTYRHNGKRQCRMCHAQYERDKRATS